MHCALPEPPHNLGVGAAFHLCRVQARELVVGFQVVVAQQILAHYAELEPFPSCRLN